MQGVWVLAAALVAVVRQGDRSWRYHVSRTITTVASPDGRVRPQRTKIYVVSLQDVPGAAPQNRHRFDDFVAHWTTMCGATAGNATDDAADSAAGNGFEFHRCAGMLHEVRGAGLAQAFPRCIDEALADAAAADGTEEFILFAEDDARLYSSELCHRGTRRDLWAAAPNDTFVLLLGGWQFRDPEHVPGGRFTRSRSSFGAYGFAVPRCHLVRLRDRWRWDADHPFLYRHRLSVAIDLSWYDEAARFRTHVYATHPLRVWHSGGFSNTWNVSTAAIYPDSLNGVPGRG